MSKSWSAIVFIFFWKNGCSSVELKESVLFNLFRRGDCACCFLNVVLNLRFTSGKKHFFWVKGRSHVFPITVFSGSFAIARVRILETTKLLYYGHFRAGSPCCFQTFWFNLMLILYQHKGFFQWGSPNLVRSKYKSEMSYCMKFTIQKLFYSFTSLVTAGFALSSDGLQPCSWRRNPLIPEK